MWKIKHEETAREYYLELGDWLYVVKFGHNGEILIAGLFLEKYEKE
ncbi:MAG: hypothetical protein ACRCU0_05220 [Candidatus Rhabdochlamydia sp.]